MPKTRLRPSILLRATITIRNKHFQTVSHTNPNQLSPTLSAITDRDLISIFYSTWPHQLIQLVIHSCIILSVT